MKGHSLAGLLTCLCLFAAPTVAGAQAARGDVPVPANEPDAAVLTDEEALAIDGQSYAQRYGVSAEEGMRRMLLMATSQEDVAEIGRSEGDRLAGVYFDHGNEFQLVVRLTGNEARGSGRIVKRGRPTGSPGALRASESARALGLSDAMIQRARDVIARDNAIDVRFTGNAKAGRRDTHGLIASNYDLLKAELPSLQGVGYDEARGVVVLQVLAEDAWRAVPPSVAAKFAVPLEIEVLPAPLELAAARGGTRIVWGGTSDLNCTVAFIGQGPSGSVGLLTAGHCNDPSWNYGYDYLDGTTRHSLLVSAISYHFDNREDWMLLLKPSGLTTLAEFFGNRNEAARKLTGRRTMSSTDARVTDNVAQGSVVCFYGMRMGPTYGQSCGEVTYKGYQFGGGAGYNVQIEGNMTCNQGDSGAPVFAWNIAFGIVNRCSPLATSQGQTTVMTYTSIDAVYASGFSLVY